MPESPEPEQITLMKRVVELAERQTQLSEQRTGQSAERSYHNAERTLSVWTRTALALMVVGLTVDRFGLLMHHTPWVSTLCGVLLTALGVVMVVSCGLRYLAYANEYRKAYPWPPKHAPHLAVTFAMLVAAFGVALIVLLIVVS
jgi:uncharacterized membrane protein YidH (DUF202 family)